MRENPYSGINAHLNSLLQTPGTVDDPSLWPGFHSQHITHIVDFLNAHLPDHYVAIGEQSLQKREFDLGGMILTTSPKPDVSIIQRQEAAERMEMGVAVAPNWEARIADLLDLELEEQPQAAVIHELIPQGKLGRTVARIELLSPSNKPGGSHHEAYEIRRIEAIESGVPLIELDYLHESSPIIPQMPAYPEQAESYPYWIIVSDPRPDWQSGSARGYGFRVGEPIKTFPLPLARDEQLMFDLNAVYQHTFRAGRWANFLDYSNIPERFHSYNPHDQMRIREIMAQVDHLN